MNERSVNRDYYLKILYLFCQIKIILGDRVIVVGQETAGQFISQFARIAGASFIAGCGQEVNISQKNMLNVYLSLQELNNSEQISLDSLFGKSKIFDVLIDTLGSWSVIEKFLPYIIDGGRVELIAEEYQGLADIDFYKEIHRRSLRINSRIANINYDMVPEDLKHKEEFLDYLIQSQKLDELPINRD